MSQDSHSDIIRVLKNFFRHPVAEIARLPSWPLKKVLFVQAGCAALSGLATGLLPPGLWKIMQGLFLFPVLVTVMSLLLSCFFYYYFLIFERRQVSFTRLVELVFFANLPYFLFHIPSAIFPPGDLFGLAMSALLLVVGLAENFGLAKKRSIRVIGFIFALLFILWIGEKISTFSRERMPDSTDEARPL